MNKILTPALLLQLSCATAQKLNHRYKEAAEVFPNPERGFYIPTGKKDHFGDASINGIGVWNLVNPVAKTSSCEPMAAA